MNKLTFDIPGDPVPFARARSNGSRRFTPPKQRAYMAAVQYAAVCAKAGKPMFPKVPLVLTVMATWAYPKSWPEKQKFPQYRTARPDVDNTVKIVADALNGIAYADYAQIAVFHTSKFYGAESFVRVCIEPLADIERRPILGADVCAGGSDELTASPILQNA